MKERRTCQTCKHFCQHYVKWINNSYHKCGSGHCVYPRLKPRRNETKACQYYSPAEKTEDG